MTVPLPVILDALSAYSLVSNLHGQDDLRFSWAHFIPAQRSEMKENRLYLCSAEQAQQMAPQFPQCYFLCTCSCKNTDDPPPNSIYVRGLESIVDLAQLVQERIIAVRDWVAQLNDFIMDNPSYQRLLDLSEPILGNPIYILDASFKLLACTQNLQDDDKIDIRLRQEGYHAEETLIAFRNSRRFQAYQNEVGTLVNPPGNPNKYATVSKWLWDRGMPVIHLIMICSNVEQPSSSLLALFEIMAQNCTLRFRQQQNIAPRTGYYYDSLFNDILFGKLDNPRIIVERAKMSGLPLAGNFNCYKIMLKDVYSYPIARLLDEFLSLIPSARGITHGYELIILNQLDSAADDLNQELLPSFLDKYDAVCGISEPFNTLLEFSVAYTQSSRALGLGEPLLAYESIWNSTVGTWNATNPPRNRSIFYYDDILVYYIASAGHNGSFDVFQKTPYLEIVQELIQGDKDHSTNNAQLLYTYLVTERKATQTGQLLHMHRNNVLYHIPRIEEKIGLSLDNYWVRMNLLLAFHLTEIEGAHEHRRQTTGEG